MNMVNPSDQTILVTGATGFVATQVIKTFLNSGYSVRGTVRSDASANAIREIFPDAGDRLSFAIVPDIAAPNAFHEALKDNDIDGVMHVASPVTFSVEDNEKDLLLPAINGILNILKAVKDNAPRVKRVVATSSFAAVLTVTEGMRPGYTYTEKDWNPATYEEAKNTDHGEIAYCASKVLAEKAGWGFMKEDANLSFDLAMINPVTVFGPVEQPVKDMSHLNESSAEVWRYMDGSNKEVETTGFPIFCDVRDVAEAHLRAYEIPEAGGERFIISADNFFWEELVHVLATIPGLEKKVPTVPDKSKWERPDTYKICTDKSKDVLGLKYRSFEETVRDTAASLLRKEMEIENKKNIGH